MSPIKKIPKIENNSSNDKRSSLSKKTKDSTYYINQYISEISDEILRIIESNNRVILDSNPATGKTTFFANLAIKLKKGEIKGRIVFLTPFLIIQDQLQSHLKKQGHDIDLIINGSTVDKTLHSSSVIISSTFHSFYHISEKLDKDDFVIVDEAHSLFYNYKEKNRKRFYFDKVVPRLYSTKAKIILMSGTPLSGLSKIFKAKIIKIRKKNPLKSKITICFSNNTPFDIANEFVERTISSLNYDSKKLNIIYIKDTKLCEEINFLITQKHKLTSKVLTSKHKEESTYKEIVSKMTVPIGVQWLVTTNIISTGANIKNKNIGKALMINEYSPIEIKQFSKRFREKLDIEVDVINQFNTNTAYESDLLLKSSLKNERKRQRKHLTNTLNNLIKIGKGSKNFKTFKYSFEKDYNGTPQHLIDIVLERFTKQESYFEELLTNINFDAYDIIKSLKKYDDIQPIEDDSLIDYKEAYQDKSYKDAISEHLKSKKDEIVSDFIKNEVSYLKGIHDMIIIKDKVLNYKFKRYFKENYSEGNILPSIKNNIQENSFRHFFVEPIFLHIEQLFTANRALYFHFNTTNNKQNKHKISVYTSFILNEFYDLKYLKSSMGGSLILKESIILKNLHPELKILIKIIDVIYNYLIDKNYFHYDDLKIHIENSVQLTIFKNHVADFVNFPLSNSTKKGKHNFLSKDLLIGIVKGIFMLRESLSDRKNTSGKTSKAYLFDDSLPEKYNLKSNMLDIDYKKIKKETVLIPSISFKKLKNNTKILSKSKILSNPTLLNYIELSENYYKITI